jgi:hypothetical protein
MENGLFDGTDIYHRADLIFFSYLEMQKKCKPFFEDNELVACKNFH